MVAQNCKEYYPDIYTNIPPNEDPERGATAQMNRNRRILYLAVRRVLRDNFGFDPDGSTTVRPEDFPSGFGKRGTSAGAKVWDTLFKQEKVFFASVYGLLLARNYTDPSLGKLAIGLPGPEDILFQEGDDTVLIVDRFIEATTDAVKLFNANRSLFFRVFEVLAREGAETLEDGTPVRITVHSRQLAEVTRRLVDDRIAADHPQIRRFVINALSQALGATIDGNASDIDIHPPSLDVGTAVEILRENVHAVSLIYFSAMLEELKFWAVMDKIAEQFMGGMIPISRGPAGDRIYEWIRETPQRLNEAERRGIYGRVLGLAQGASAEGAPNREFADLWLRFLSTVNLLHRERGQDVGLGQRIVAVVPSVSEEQAHKAARDLSVNISLHGYGIAHFGAVEMQRSITFIRDTLNHSELLKAYAVNDWRQLVERVSSLYLNGAVNGVRYVTMAQSGAAVITWLARNAPRIAADHPLGERFFLTHDLVPHVNQWLAVTGNGSTVIEQRTQPIDLAAQPTIPSMFSGNGARVSTSSPVIRQALEQAGIGGLPAIPQV
jgi:hypothetical protein